MTAAELLAAFVGDRVSRVEQHPGQGDQARPGYFYLHVLFESGRILIFPIAREVGFLFDDEPARQVREDQQPLTGEQLVLPDPFGIISEQGVAAYPSEEAFLKDWEVDPATQSWRRKTR